MFSLSWLPDPNNREPPGAYAIIYILKTISKYWLLIIGTSLAVITGFLTLYLHYHTYFPGDLRISLWVQMSENRPLTLILEGLAWIFGSWHAAIPIVLSGVIIYWKLGKLETLLIAAAGLFSLINEGIKVFIARPRPTADQVRVLMSENSFSFPSSHAFFACLFLGILIFILIHRLKRSTLRTFVITILSVLALLVGFSRIYLGVHWYSDVIAGYIFGGFFLNLLIAGYMVLEKRRPKRFEEELSP